MEPKVDEYGNKRWYLNNLLHREDGPAVEWASGSKEWHLNGKYHRTDGPAIEWADGYRAWRLNGKRHRSDGPATESVDGTKEWWIKDEQLFKEDFSSLDQIIKMQALELFTPQEIVRMRGLS